MPNTPQNILTPRTNAGVGIGPSAQHPVEGLDSLFSKKGARKTGRRDSSQLVAPPIQAVTIHETPIPPSNVSQPQHQPKQKKGKNKQQHQQQLHQKPQISLESFEPPPVKNRQATRKASVDINSLSSALDSLSLGEKTPSPTVKESMVKSTYIPLQDLQQEGATLAKEKIKANLKSDHYVRRFEDKVHYDSYHRINKSLQQGEKTLTLTGADFSNDGNCFFTVPLEAERIKVREINLTNLMPTININSNYTIKFEEQSFTGKASTGIIIETAPLAQGIYDLTTMKAAIETAMYTASFNHFGVTYANNYTVTFSRLSGTTTIACHNQGIARNFRLYYTSFARDVLGYDPTTDLLEGGTTFYQTITSSNVFSFVYGGTISIESNLSSYTNTVGKNRNPTLAVIPLSSPQFFALNIRPDFPPVDLGEKKAISNIKLTFRNASDQSVLNKYIFQAAALFYIVFSYE